MRLEVPELLERNAVDVDDVGGQGDGCRGGVGAVGQLGAQRLGEAREVFVESEETKEFGGRLPVGDGLGGVRFGGFFVGGHGLGVEVTDLEEVEGDASVLIVIMSAHGYICTISLGEKEEMSAKRVVITNLLSLLPVH